MILNVLYIYLVFFLNFIVINNNFLKSIKWKINGKGSKSDKTEEGMKRHIK